MIDRTTKMLLAAIALGLWLNALVPVLRPQPALAQQDDRMTRIIMTAVMQTQSDVSDIARGACRNQKICGY